MPFSSESTTTAGENKGKIIGSGLFALGTFAVGYMMGQGPGDSPDQAPSYVTLAYNQDGNMTYANGSVVAVPVNTSSVQDLIEEFPDVQSYFDGKDLGNYQARFQVNEDRSLDLIIENKSDSNDTQEIHTAGGKSAYNFLFKTLGEMPSIIPQDALTPNFDNATDQKRENGFPFSMALTGNYSQELLRELGMTGQGENYRYQFEVGFDNKTNQLRGNLTTIDESGNITENPANITEEQIYKIFDIDTDGTVGNMDAKEYLDQFKEKAASYYKGYEDAHALYEDLGKDYEQLRSEFENLQELWGEYNITHNITWQQFVDLQNLWANENITQMNNMTWTQFITYITQNITDGYDSGYENGTADANAIWQSLTAGWNDTHYQQGFQDGYDVGLVENTTADLMSRNSTAFQAGVNGLLDRGCVNYTITNRSELESYVANVTELSFLLNVWDNMGLEELLFLDTENDAVYSGMWAGYKSGVDVSRIPLFEQNVQDTRTELSI